MTSAIAIIAAGGSGTRMGAGVPKQALEIGGRSILARSVAAIAASNRVSGIVIVVPPALEREAAAIDGAGKSIRVVLGGPRRQDSVANGFAAVDDQAGIVLVHDAARPFVPVAVIDRTVDAAAQHGAAIAAIRASDTVKLTADAGSRDVGETIPRDRVWLAQTPQAFRWQVLSDAIAVGRAGVEGTDEAALAEQAGHRVQIVDGDPRNIKITTREDLDTAREWVERDAGDVRGSAGVPDRRARADVPADEEQRSAGVPAGELLTRVGIGYDSHRLVDRRPLVLAGVRIPFDRGLQGHSDADIVCHAVTDAILGAACAGDIGQLFPDTAAEWKDASSVDLLERALARVREGGWVVGNVDVVIIAERPKMAPHVPAMRTSLAAALGVAAEAVSIKAKTNEGLDAIGRGEAMAAQAVALLRVRS